MQELALAGPHLPWLASCANSSPATIAFPEKERITRSKGKDVKAMGDKSPKNKEKKKKKADKKVAPIASSVVPGKKA